MRTEKNIENSKENNSIKHYVYYLQTKLLSVFAFKRKIDWKIASCADYHLIRI